MFVLQQVIVALVFVISCKQVWIIIENGETVRHKLVLFTVNKFIFGLTTLTYTNIGKKNFLKKIIGH